jgi:hypothetical protein
LNETPEVNRGRGASYKKEHIEGREIVPLDSECDDCRCRTNGLGGQVIRPPLGLHALRGGVETTAKIPQMLASAEVHAMHDRSDVSIQRPMVKNDILIAPNRNT